MNRPEDWWARGSGDLKTKLVCGVDLNETFCRLPPNHLGAHREGEYDLTPFDSLLADVHDAERELFGLHEGMRESYCREVDKRLTDAHAALRAYVISLINAGQTWKERAEKAGG